MRAIIKDQALWQQLVPSELLLTGRVVEMSDKMNLDKCHDNCTCITFRCQKNDCIHGIQFKNWACFC